MGRLVVLLLALCALPVGAVGPADGSFGCDRIQSSPLNAWHVVSMRQLCRDLETNQLRGKAKREGSPRPSATVVRLPAYGSEAGATLGLVCLSGRAMRRLPNGWEQLVDAGGDWQRCAPGR